MRAALAAAVLAALALASTAAAFTPTDPLAPKQWYLQQDHAFDAWPDGPPTFANPVKVALVDSGVDCKLPDFAGRIAAARSFVGGDPCLDTDGHGTFVAGIVAANVDGGGIVGIAYTAQLLVAKVVKTDGTIPLEAESRAIRWAADSGARVINLSLGGVRDPVHPTRDTYSQEEADAVAYANAKGALVVAAVGNGDEATYEPYPYASYPAALPHVLGVGALTQSGDVPDYSNRDAVFNDLSAPGSAIFSTFPSQLTGLRPTCTDQGFSDCGTKDYETPEGTSFAAPQVTAAAAVLFELLPTLTSSQAAYILEHSTDDVNAATGCPRCALGRDRFSGWGRLDIAKAVGALSGPLPPADTYETNDDAGSAAHVLWGQTQSFSATLDYYDDPVDVYRVEVRKGQTLKVAVNASWTGANVSVELWRPGTRKVDVPANVPKLRAAQSAGGSATPHIAFRAPATGWYYVEVKTGSPGAGSYALKLAKTTPLSH
ncbi:MAG: S8 family serine peptidase [Actinomycetota bacterium]